jgi:hypothetical protein
MPQAAAVSLRGLEVRAGVVTYHHHAGAKIDKSVLNAVIGMVGDLDVSAEIREEQGWSAIDIVPRGDGLSTGDVIVGIARNKAIDPRDQDFGEEFRLMAFHLVDQVERCDRTMRQFDKPSPQLSLVEIQEKMRAHDLFWKLQTELARLISGGWTAYATCTGQGDESHLVSFEELVASPGTRLCHKCHVASIQPYSPTRWRRRRL